MPSLPKLFHFFLLACALVLPGAFAVLVVAVARKWVFKKRLVDL